MHLRRRLPVLKWRDNAKCIHFALRTVSTHERKSSSSAQHLIHAEVNSQDLIKYKNLYDHIDKERNGIKVCDFLKIVRELGLTATEEEIEHLFKGLKLKSYGVMTEKEFISFISKIKATQLGKLGVESHGKDGSQDDSQTWWTSKVNAMKSELAHYKRGFYLLKEQLKFAATRTRPILEGRTLSRYETRKVYRAVRDFLMLIPMATVAMLPGGSIAVAFVVKYFPQFLPSTFRLENMTHQRKNEIVITEVTACLEEMERKLQKEKIEWIASDTSVSKLLKFILSPKCDTMSLDIFLHNNELNIMDDTHIKTNGIIDRLDSTWLVLLCQNSMSTAGSGKHDPRNIAKSPSPILRSLLRRRMKQIAHRNKTINNNPDEILKEQLLLESDAWSSVLQTRGIPPTLTLAETHVWIKLEDDLSILLSYLFHLRKEYLTIVTSSVIKPQDEDI